MRKQTALGALALATVPTLLTSPAHADDGLTGLLRPPVRLAIQTAENAVPLPLSAGGKIPLIDPKREDAVDDIVTSSFDTFLAVEDDPADVVPATIRGATRVLGTVENALPNSPHVADPTS